MFNKLYLATIVPVLWRGAGHRRLTGVITWVPCRTRGTEWSSTASMCSQRTCMTNSNSRRTVSSSVTFSWGYRNRAIHARSACRTDVARWCCTKAESAIRTFLFREKKSFLGVIKKSILFKITIIIYVSAEDTKNNDKNFCSYRQRRFLYLLSSQITYKQ